jgi:hypothetical protein
MELLEKNELLVLAQLVGQATVQVDASEGYTQLKAKLLRIANATEAQFASEQPEDVEPAASKKVGRS